MDVTDLTRLGLVCQQKNEFLGVFFWADQKAQSPVVISRVVQTLLA